MNRKGIRWLVTALMAAAALTAILGMLARYLSVDFSGLREAMVQKTPQVLGSDLLKDLASGVGGAIEELIKQLIEAVSGNKDTLVLSFTGFGLLNKLPGWSGQLKQFPGLAGALRWAIVLVLIPMVFAALTGGISFFRRRWSYVITLITSLIGFAGTLISVLYVFPHVIYKAIMGIQMSDVLGKTGHVLTDSVFLEGILTYTGGGMDALTGGTVEQVAELFAFKESTLRSFVRRGLGPAFWISVICLGILVALSIVGIVISGAEKPASSGRKSSGGRSGGKSSGGRSSGTKSKVPGSGSGLDKPLPIPAGGYKKTYSVYGPAVRSAAEPGICCGFGPLANTVIPMAAGDQLILGSDPARCNLIVTGVGIAPVHCSVRLNAETGEYIVIASEDGEVYLRGQRMRPGHGQSLPGGETFYLGNERNSVRLC